MLICDLVKSLKGLDQRDGESVWDWKSRVERTHSEIVKAFENPDHYHAVCVDLDGVLAKYEGWKGHGVIGDPILGSTEFLLALKKRGYRVIVFTARGTGEVWDWLHTWALADLVDEVNVNSSVISNNMGKPVANFYVDDRAIRFRGSYLDVLEEIDGFVEWWQDKQLTRSENNGNEQRVEKHRDLECCTIGPDGTVRGNGQGCVPCEEKVRQP